MIQAIILERHENNTLASIKKLPSRQFSNGDVLVKIHYSTINYKDALMISGIGDLAREYPMIPGSDFSGTVINSQDPRFKPEQSVFLTGHGLGIEHWGGLAEQARVTGEWLLPLPDGLTLRNAMIIGTAGLTAMLCIMALEESGITPDCGKILVTGASGGVGSTAICLLSELGYAVTALTGRLENSHYLRKLGAADILDRKIYSQQGRALEKQVWAGAIDVLGGNILANILACMKDSGTVAACGLAYDYLLPTTIMPFILRNIRLQGVNSDMISTERRLLAWQRLIKILPPHYYKLIVNQITLPDTIIQANYLINQKVTGRILVKVA